MECTTRLIFVGFSIAILFFMHLNLQRLSGMHSSCVITHERTLSHLDDFKNSLMDSDLLVSFVDKSDLAHLERERKEAERKVSRMVGQMKKMQKDLAVAKFRLLQAEKKIKLMQEDKDKELMQAEKMNEVMVAQEKKPQAKKEEVISRRLKKPKQFFLPSFNPPSFETQESNTCQEIRELSTKMKHHILQVKLKLKHLREYGSNC